MKTELLEVFVQVVRLGSFASAAEARGIAASTVSRSIASLEEDLETRLFQRTTRSMRTTPAGRALFEQVEPLLEQLEQVRERMRDGGGEPSGRVCVSASTSFGQHVIAPQIGRLRQRHPGIALDLRLSDERVDLVREGVDIAVRHGALDDSTWVARRLRRVHYRLVASPAYLKTHDAVTKPQDLSCHEVVSYTLKRFRSMWRFKQGRRTEDVQLEPAMVVSTASAIRACALAGVGVALLADWLVDTDLESGDLVQLLPEWAAGGPSFDASLWCVRPARAHTPARVQAVVRFLMEVARSSRA